MTMTKNKLYHMVLAGILCAIGIVVPMFMPRIVLGPMSFTLASHVAVFLGMFISPAVAVAVCIGTTIGFFLTTPAIIALRAASHIVFAFIGAAYLKRNPDIKVALLDIMLPDMDGYEVIKHLKADPALQDIPVIFLTALHNPEDIVKGFKLGASDYVSKPFNHEELITRVSHHIYLAAAQRTIMQQRDELQATVDARDKMYSVIAHDLRSPIGTLKMVFNMLSINLTQQQIGEDNMEMITMGNNITESTFMLLDNLLKWTKSQIGRMNTVFQEVDISEVVVFASKMSDLVAQVKNIAVEYDIPGPITVPCDVDMVKTIMRNLMSNAIKYSNEGGRIVISVRETPTHAVISVRDFGTGISEENLPKLLNPEIHHTTYGTKNEEGSGLGLQLVQDLTRRNGGELTIESTLGEGSTFTFTIAKVQPKSETVEDSEGGGIARP